MLNCGQNLARNSRCFDKKPNQVQEYYNSIRSGRYLKRENLFLDVVPKVKTECPSSALMHSTIKTAAITTIMWKPWIGRTVAIVQSNFWTMVAIVTIATIIWKPGFMDRRYQFQVTIY